MIRVYKEEIMMLVFILALNTFNRLIYEASFVLGFFSHLYEKNLKHNVSIWVQFFNLILVMFPLVSYDQIYRRKTSIFISFHNEMEVGVFGVFFVQYLKMMRQIEFRV